MAGFPEHPTSPVGVDQDLVDLASIESETQQQKEASQRHRLSFTPHIQNKIAAWLTAGAVALGGGAVMMEHPPKSPALRTGAEMGSVLVAAPMAAAGYGRLAKKVNPESPQQPLIAAAPPPPPPGQDSEVAAAIRKEPESQQRTVNGVPVVRPRDPITPGASEPGIERRHER